MKEVKSSSKQPATHATKVHIFILIQLISVSKFLKIKMSGSKNQLKGSRFIYSVERRLFPWLLNISEHKMGERNDIIPKLTLYKMQQYCIYG
ncbi:hypothetical protein J2X69_003609 [Algoriphagus sp. 4150]|nr:hypothetical protein [Algoriphagus sp. 4150]